MNSFLTADGKRLEYRSIRAIGEPSTPPIVFLHEGLGSTDHWQEFPDEVCRAVGTEGFVYSRVGYGASDRVELPRQLDYLRQEGRALPAVLDAAGLDEVVLFGHSDGSSIALAASEALGGRATSMVLEAPHVFTEPSGLEAIRQATEAYGTTDLRDKLERYHADVDGAFWGWANAWLDPAFLDPDLTDCLPGIETPLLLIQGLDDPYGSLAHVETIAVSVAGHAARLDLAECGHAPHKDRPEDVITATEEFLRSPPPSP